MAERRTHQGTVLRTEQLTDHMIRVVLGGDGLADFEAGAYSDHYVKLLFPAPGDPGRTVRRTYTVRAWDPVARELSLDFVYHGDEGIAGPWAANARPGDQLAFMGPGGGYTPDPAADWHLLAGDESALPAIAASLERLAHNATARVFVEVAGPDEEQKLSLGDDGEVAWIHRGGGVIGEALLAAVRALEFPPGVPQVFVHGEANFVKGLRHLLRVERGIAREQLSISGYWRRGADEDGWQSSKREWNEAVEADEARALRA
jgi:NADPH-dependent ferric siderophore reductase